MSTLTGLLATLLMIVSACKPEPRLIQVTNTGYAQGSTFQVKYRVLDGTDYSKEIKGIFEAVDASMSTYQPNSLISMINKGDTLVTVDSLFRRVLERSLEISKESNGQFDATIGPMVELWGFGLSKKDEVDSARVDSVRAFIGYDNVEVDGTKVKVPRGFKLDFNAIAQGYTVDVIAAFLQGKGIEHYMVEVGGEVRAKGTNTDGEVWRIGIDKPTEELDET
ncbi:MAG: FAD:protein FMN transferase, partial [Owenweeksia sp.]